MGAAVLFSLHAIATADMGLFTLGLRELAADGTKSKQHHANSKHLCCIHTGRA